METKAFALSHYDWIVINTSAGKDSQAMHDLVHALAVAEGVEDRIVAVHCDLGRVEWAETKELAAEHAAFYGHRFEVVSRERDLLHQVEFERKKFPAKGIAQFCTSDHKTSQVAKLHTRLAKEKAGLGRPVRILDCLGLRKDESDCRGKRLTEMEGRNGMALEPAVRATRNVVVDKWYPIADWTLEMVWTRIREARTRHHKAYDLGMSRLSCAFCILASPKDLRISGKANPELAAEYIGVEERIGFTFKHKASLASILAEVPEVQAAVARRKLPVVA